jgi:hypothetical protein
MMPMTMTMNRKRAGALSLAFIAPETWLCGLAERESFSLPRIGLSRVASALRARTSQRSISTGRFVGMAVTLKS